MRSLLLLVGVVLLTTQLSAQQRTVIGKVTDVSGNPVPNATVLVKGPNSEPQQEQTAPTLSPSLPQQETWFYGNRPRGNGSFHRQQRVINASLLSSDKKPAGSRGLWLWHNKKKRSYRQP